MSRPHSGFLGALVVLAHAGVDFVVVGTGGINFYASDAFDETGARIDLMLSGGGFVFDDLASDATLFRIGETEIRVGSIARLLRSKELAGRPKDVEFLRMFAARLREEAGTE